jgi:hypothetical protein
MAKRMFSVFTDDMDHCMFTGSNVVERHHIFYQMGGGMKEKCEKYGFTAPLRPDLHPNGVHAGKQAKEVDQKLKMMAQEYYEAHYGTREEFMAEFGKNNL